MCKPQLVLTAVGMVLALASRHGICCLRVRCVNAGNVFLLSALAAQAYALKEENDSLRWQLDAYRNEVELLKQEKGQHFRSEESLTKDQQLQFLQQTLQGMQQVSQPKRSRSVLSIRR